MEQFQPLYIRNTQCLKVGLSWDLLEESKVDLDASCFVFDETGNLLDIVYYNQLSSLDKAIVHSGDEKTGALEGFDEFITVYIPTLHPSVHILIFVITVHSKHTFGNVETALCAAWDGAGDEIVNYSIGEFGQQKAMIMSMAAKLNGAWYFYRLGQPSFAPSLDQTLPDLDKALGIVITPEILAERKKINTPQLNISKGDEYELRVASMFLGLGWDAGCDLDAWCYMVGPDSAQVCVVYFGNLTSPCGSVKHSGDNLTGEGAGDDERIFVNLPAVPKNVHFLFFVIKIYTGGKKFDSVKNPFVRIVDGKLNKQLCMFQPKQIASSSNALIVGCIHRTHSAGWSFLAMGLATDKDRVNSKTLADTFFRVQKGRKKEYLFKVLVVGDVATGKTSIIKRYTSNNFGGEYKSTIGVDFAVKTISLDERTTVKLQLWDIAGQERFASMTRVYYNNAVGAFVVLDVTRDSTFQGTETWKRDIDSKITIPGTTDPIPVIALANKVDLLKVGEEIQLRERMDRLCKELEFHAWYETSAKEDISINDAIKCLVRLMVEKVPAEVEMQDETVSLNIADKKNEQSCC